MLNLNFIPFPIIKTKRLLLREVRIIDVNEIFFLRSDAEVMKYINKTLAKNIEDALAFIAKMQEFEINKTAITWAICLKEDEKLIGTICIWNIDKDHHRGEVGYSLHPSHHKKGIMQEAIVQVLNYGFRIMKLHSMEAIINPNNAASEILLERNGFVREGYFKENYFYNGQYLDSAVFSLLTPAK